jgi:hypothetical protein
MPGAVTTRRARGRARELLHGTPARDDEGSDAMLQAAHFPQHACAAALRPAPSPSLTMHSR